tara:strand:- start:236 stop:463 length:228 start_codon:yes stop_codon:yes gene_type:complete
MKQTITMSDTWFETIEALSIVQKAKEDIEWDLQHYKGQELKDRIFEIADIELSNALASITKLIIRSQDLERYKAK